MAKVTSTTTTVVVEKKVPGYTVELTEAEAKTVALVLAFVGGDPSKSARGEVESVLDALRDAGIQYDATKDYGLIRGNLSFGNRFM